MQTFELVPFYIFNCLYFKPHHFFFVATKEFIRPIDLSHNKDFISFTFVQKPRTAEMMLNFSSDGLKVRFVIFTQ